MRVFPWKRLGIGLLVLLLLAGLVLFCLCVFPFGLVYALEYDCLLSDPALREDLAYLTERDCLLTIRSTKQSYGQTVTVGTNSTPEDDPDGILKRLCEGGGVIWKDAKIGSTWEERIAAADFRMQDIVVNPGFFLDRGRLTGAAEIHFGLYPRWLRLLRSVFG